MPDEGFALNLVFKSVKSSYICAWNAEPDGAKPDHSDPDHAESNQGLQCQIVMWDLCSCEKLCSAES